MICATTLARDCAALEWTDTGAGGGKRIRGQWSEGGDGGCEEASSRVVVGGSPAPSIKTWMVWRQLFLVPLSWMRQDHHSRSHRPQRRQPDSQSSNTISFPWYRALHISLYEYVDKKASYRNGASSAIRTLLNHNHIHPQSTSLRVWGSDPIIPLPHLQGPRALLQLPAASSTRRRPITAEPR